MESAAQNYLIRTHSSFNLQRAPYVESDSVLLLNEELDNLRLPHEINEPSIERFLKILEDSGASDLSCYWLMMARIFELALICAGQYADNCELSTAGDLLVNPRKVLVHRKDHPNPLVKHRHTRISEELNKGDWCKQDFLIYLKNKIALEIVKPAILPFLFEQMQQSRMMAAWYLNKAGERMKKIADTIGFLAAWSVSSFEDFHKRLQTASPKTCAFVSDHLCRFDDQYFKQLGQEIQIVIDKPEVFCEFLVHQ